MKRIITVLAVTAIVAAMLVVMAVPAMAKTDKDPGEAGQPGFSGNEGGGAVVAHCTPQGKGKSVTVITLVSDQIAGGGDCNPLLP